MLDTAPPFLSLFRQTLGGADQGDVFEGGVVAARDVDALLVDEHGCLPWQQDRARASLQPERLHGFQEGVVGVVVDTEVEDLGT